ncbi:Oxidoreductase [uncultured Synechococcales cyanobacterium]|uniref:Oxidoreductase n=1 Tax=uncultured Synechococcales cyanobacterium TaxID=1936017 RepID=A0A6J4VPL0_9CYAN|nr:Oxidoreductase [uncultured Synechococcales cyanobacterium]
MDLLKVEYRDPDAPLKFAKSLHQIGFAVLVDPPIPPQLVAETYAEWQRFFNSEQKYDYRFDPQRQSGYFPFQTEQAKDYSCPDLKEFFHLYRWTELPAGISDRSWQLFNCLVELAEVLLHWVEQALPPDRRSQLTMPLSTMIAGSQESLLRLIHYPPLQKTELASSIRAAAHEDVNLITLLPAATAVGLEVQDNQGDWHQVLGGPEDLIVNVGDMLQLATGRYYRSTAHRVVNPSGDWAKQSRFSMPLFLHPRPEVILTEGITAHSYLQDRLRQIGLLEVS